MTQTVTRLPAPELVARHWADAVYGTSYLAMDRTDLTTFLTGLTRGLLAAAQAEPFDPAPAHTTGWELVAAHCTEARSLEATLVVLADQLADLPPARLSRLLAALSAGYASALQNRTRTEQERVSRSAYVARAAADRARWNSEARFAAVFAGAGIGIGVAALDGEILEVNPALCDLLGLPHDQYTGRSLFAFTHPDDDPEVWTGLSSMLMGEVDRLRVEKSFVHADGRVIRTEIALSLVRERSGSPRYLVAMVEDVTERRRLEDELRHQAQHDPLTGLPNRALFFDRLDAALAEHGADVGVCYLDLDGFKAVNDTLGHAVGDELLRQIARRLQTELAEDGAGHLVARMGGDEFVIMVERGAGRDRLHQVARTALATVAQPLRLGRRDIVISASLGVVDRRDGDGVTAAELMKAADTTLYWAKNDGRNRYAFFDPDRHRAEIARFGLSARMPEALARGEFAVDYQPLVRLTDGRLIGVEALVRWRPADGTVLSPDQFVPLAEENGLIVPMGRAVLEEACRQAARWRAEHPGPAGEVPLFMSVNLAARQVREPGIVEDVERVLRTTGWPAHALQLELTETDVMATTGEPLRVLRRLAAMGVRIAIDDFGTGYSNLAYLRDLPVHVLKLAGPFVAGRPGSGDLDEIDGQVLSHLIGLAHTLGLSVTAEHVETAAQADRLRRLGCDVGQGWFFAPASDPGTISGMLRRPAGT